MNEHFLAENDLVSSHIEMKRRNRDGGLNSYFMKKGDFSVVGMTKSVLEKLLMGKWCIWSQSPIRKGM